jgi:predicted transcriptional regulator
MDPTYDQIGRTFDAQTSEAGAARAEDLPATPHASASGGAEGEASEAAGSVDKIRDILFGVQMRDYDKRFAGVEERLSRELAALKDETTRRFDALQASMREALDNIGQRLTTEQETRTNTVQALGHDLGRQLSDQGQQITSELVRRFDELSASLERQAGALRHEKTDRATLAALLTEMAQRLNSGRQGA